MPINLSDHPEIAKLSSEERVKRYLEALQQNKVEIVSSRDNPNEVLEWVKSSLPEQFHTVAVIGVIMMQNTMIDVITTQLKELTEPSQ